MSNALRNRSVYNPFGALEPCIAFDIDDLSQEFALTSIMQLNQTYTLSFWILSNKAASITAAGVEFETSPTWAKHVVTFKASVRDLVFRFGTEATYTMYHPQLEIGGKATDWTVSKEDVDDAIVDAKDYASDQVDDLNEYIINNYVNFEKLEDRLRNIVRRTRTYTDENGDVVVEEDTTLMDQDADGWYFNMTGYDNKLDDLEKKTAYIHITTDEDNKPLIALGADDSDFKLHITNTDIRFMEGSTVPAYINNQSLYIGKAVVEEELRQGQFIWKQRPNGNLGLVWIGGTE